MRLAQTRTPRHNTHKDCTSHPIQDGSSIAPIHSPHCLFFLLSQLTPSPLLPLLPRPPVTPCLPRLKVQPIDRGLGRQVKIYLGQQVVQ